MSLKRMVDEIKQVTGLFAVVPSSSVPDRVSMRNYDGVLAVITQSNSTSATGSAVTLKQSKTVAGGSEKALGFDKVWKNLDVGAAGGDVLTEVAVVSDTFTTESTDSKITKYMIDIKGASMDTNDGFDVFGLGVADGAANTVHVDYFLYNARYKPVQEDTPTLD